MAGPVLDEMKTDALGEVYNIAMGSAATAVSGMIGETVSITAPEVTVCQASNIVKTKLNKIVKGILFTKGEENVYVKVKYTSGIKGTSVMVFNQEDMEMVVNKLMGNDLDVSDDFEFDEMSISAVTELMNQMMGAAATSLSQVVNTAVSIAPPETTVSANTKTLYKLQEIDPDDEVCVISFDIAVGDAIDSRFILILPVGTANSMASSLLGIEEDEDEDEDDEDFDDEDEDIEEDDEDDEEEEDIDQDSILSGEKRDAIGEIQNIMMGSAATALSNFMNAKVWITTPKVTVKKAGKISFEELDPSICVKIKYVKGIHGASVLVLKQNDVQMMVNQLMGLPPEVTDDFEFDEMNISAVCEIMNQMMGASATTLSEIINTPTDISTPEAVVIQSDKDILKLNNLETSDYACLVSFDLTIDGITSSHFVTMLSIDLAEELAEKVIASYSSDLDEYEEEAKESKKDKKKSKKKAVEPEPEEDDDEEEEEEKPAKKSRKKAEEPSEPAKPKKAAKTETAKPKPAPVPKSRVVANGSAGKSLNVQEFHIDSLDEEEEKTPPLTEKQYKNLNSLLDVPMDVTVLIGSTQKSIEEVGNFTKGTVIELDTLANEPVDILVNGNLIAKGDVVVVDDNFAIRITEVIDKYSKYRRF